MRSFDKDLCAGDFTSVDVETANYNKGSLCAIALIKWRGGRVVDSLSTYINPEQDFAIFHKRLHGITELAVENAPRFIDIHKKINGFMLGQAVVSHTRFDFEAISSAYLEAGLSLPSDIDWVDSCDLARQAFPTKLHHDLKSLAKDFGVSFQHHTAFDDAVMAGAVAIRSLTELGLAGEAMLDAPPIETVGGVNERGAYFGDDVVFTGDLTIPRPEAIKLAHKVGLKERSGVSRKTDFLVVGSWEFSRIKAGEKASTKYKKALDLIKEGVGIRVLDESGFVSMCRGV